MVAMGTERSGVLRAVVDVSCHAEVVAGRVAGLPAGVAGVAVAVAGDIVAVAGDIVAVAGDVAVGAGDVAVVAAHASAAEVAVFLLVDVVHSPVAVVAQLLVVAALGAVDGGNQFLAVAVPLVVAAAVCVLRAVAVAVAAVLVAPCEFLSEAPGAGAALTSTSASSCVSPAA